MTDQNNPPHPWANMPGYTVTFEDDGPFHFPTWLDVHQFLGRCYEAARESRDDHDIEFTVSAENPSRREALNWSAKMDWSIFEATCETPQAMSLYYGISQDGWTPTATL